MTNWLRRFEPSVLWTVAGAMLVLVCLPGPGYLVWSWVTTGDRGVAFVAPGRQSVRVSEPGTYRIWNEWTRAAVAPREPIVVGRLGSGAGTGARSGGGLAFGAVRGDVSRGSTGRRGGGRAGGRPSAVMDAVSGEGPTMDWGGAAAAPRFDLSVVHAESGRRMPARMTAATDERMRGRDWTSVIEVRIPEPGRYVVVAEGSFAPTRVLFDTSGASGFRRSEQIGVLAAGLASIGVLFGLCLISLNLTMKRKLVRRQLGVRLGRW